MIENPETWHDRDLPVLRFLVAHFDANPGRRIDVGDIALGMTPNDEGRFWDNETVARSAAALNRSKLVSIYWYDRLSGRSVAGVAEISGEAHRLVGAWPSPATATDRLIAALEKIAVSSDNEDERTRARRILDAFAGSGRQIAVGVATAVVTGQVT